VLGLPLELTDSEEGSALGAALLGGVAGGIFVDVADAVERCVRIGDTIEPDPSQLALYAELHAGYQALYPALREVRLRR
jgi:xylulokinase